MRKFEQGDDKIDLLTFLRTQLLNPCHPFLDACFGLVQFILLTTSLNDNATNIRTNISFLCGTNWGLSRIGIENGTRDLISRFLKDPIFLFSLQLYMHTGKRPRPLPLLHSSQIIRPL